MSASENWQGDVEVIPTIVSLRARLEEIRLGEVRKTLARLSDAGPETRAAIDALSAAIVNTIAHTPITKLRESSQVGASPSWLELVHELLGLGRADDRDRDPDPSRRSLTQHAASP